MSALAFLASVAVQPHLRSDHDMAHLPMSVLAILSTIAMQYRILFRSNVSTQTQPNIAEAATQTELHCAHKTTQTDPCGFQSIGYTVLRRCPHPDMVWDYIDARPSILDCGVELTPPAHTSAWTPFYKPTPN